MSGFDWEGVLGADDPEEYMDILEDKIAEADQYMSHRDDYNQPSTNIPRKSLPYKTSFSANISGIDEFVNLGMGFKSYKTFNRFVDDQKIPRPEEINDLQNQVEKLYSFANIIKTDSLFIVPSVDFNLSNQFVLNSEFDVGHLSGKVNIISFLMAKMMEQYSNGDYAQRRTNKGHSFWGQSGAAKTIYIFNGIFRKEMKAPLEDYAKQLRKQYGDDVKIVLIALTEAQSNAVHFRIATSDLPSVVSYDDSVGFNAHNLTEQLPQDLANKGLLLYKSNPAYASVMEQLTSFDNIQNAKKTLVELVDDLFIDVDCSFDSYTGRISSINLKMSKELWDLDRRSQLPF